MSELDDLIHEAADWLRIPSISAGARNDEALQAAAEWAQRRVLAAGGTCDLVDTPGGAPLVVGELKARAGAPTVLIYGHYDVQDPGDESDWTTPPFEPDIRDGRIYARGACDDKGNFLPLLHVACAMADAGELPVNVRVLVEGAEETGGDRGQRLGDGRRARRRLRDRLRRRDARRGDAGADGRDARHGLRPPDRPHRRADRALGPLRRRRPERRARAARRPRGGAAGRRRPPPGATARRGRAAERRGGRLVGPAARRRRRSSRRPAPARRRRGGG